MTKRDIRLAAFWLKLFADGVARSTEPKELKMRAELIDLSRKLYALAREPRQLKLTERSKNVEVSRDRTFSQR